jgi:hypothetical protein
MKWTPFQHLIKEISHSDKVNQSRHPVHWQTSAIRAIHEAREAFLCREFESELLHFILWVYANLDFSGSLLCPSHKNSHNASKRYAPCRHPVNCDRWPFVQWGVTTCSGCKIGLKGGFFLDDYRFIFFYCQLNCCGHGVSYLRVTSNYIVTLLTHFLVLKLIRLKNSQYSIKECTAEVCWMVHNVLSLTVH